MRGGASEGASEAEVWLRGGGGSERGLVRGAREGLVRGLVSGGGIGRQEHG